MHGQGAVFLDAIILAGGRGQRMGGTEKAFLRLGRGNPGGRDGTTFIEHLVATLAPLVRSVIVSTNDPRQYSHLAGVRVVPDEKPGQGPLMGLYVGLKASSAEWCLVTCVDAPLVRVGLIQLLASETPGFDAVVPVWERGPEPLCALYARRCLPAIEKTIHLRRVVSFYPSVRVNLLPEAAVRGVDPEGLSFFNTNTIEDYDRLLTMQEAMK